MKTLLCLAIMAVSALMPQMSLAQSVLSPDKEDGTLRKELILEITDSVSTFPGSYEYRGRPPMQIGRQWPGQEKTYHFISHNDLLYSEIKSNPGKADIEAEPLSQVLVDSYCVLYKQKLQAFKLSDAKQDKYLEDYRKSLMQKKETGNYFVLIYYQRKG